MRKFNWVISEFKGVNFFLSNMYPCKIKLGSVTYSCAEAAFQAVKLADKAARKQFAGLDGKRAKALGRKVQLRSDWEKIKVDVMRWIVAEKFNQNPDIRFKLYRFAYDTELVEGNTWGDTFWGVCNGVGQNWLGKILMEYAEKTPTELETMEEYDDVPDEIKHFKIRLQCEYREAGHETVGCRYYKTADFYAVEMLTKNPIDEVSRAIYFVTKDANESACVLTEKIRD